MGYVELTYTPGEDDLICTFRVKAHDLRRAAEAVAAESSIGTWTDVMTMKEEIRERLRARVFEIRDDVIKVAYPGELFEKGNIPQILSSIAGNIFGMREVEGLRLEDVEIPRSIALSFSGPAFGIDGVREKLKIEERPLVGTIVKPKVGLSPEEHAEVVYRALRGGCDLVKDDENLTSQDFNPFEKRLKLSLDAVKRAEDETGEEKGYLPNITAETQEMLRRAELVKELGGKFIMVDVVTCGFSGLQTLRKHDFGMIIHAHRAMHAAFTRKKDHGISMLVLAKFLRMCGVDQLHIGTVVGKMEGEKEDVLRIRDAITGEFYGIKPVFPVASGGLHPGHIPALYSIFGKDVILQFGGGIHGHPDGTEEGARAVREALSMVLEGKPLDNPPPALKKAIEKWGISETL